MRASDIREQTQQELEEKLDDVKKNLFNLKFQKAIGQLENTQAIRSLKKDIARIETVLRGKSSDTGNSAGSDTGNRAGSKKVIKKDTGKPEVKKKKSIRKETAKMEKASEKGDSNRTGTRDA
jgi:large subunit ribosomal protein L29